MVGRFHMISRKEYSQLRPGMIVSFWRISKKDREKNDELCSDLSYYREWKIMKKTKQSLVMQNCLGWEREVPRECIGDLSVDDMDILQIAAQLQKKYGSHQ